MVPDDYTAEGLLDIFNGLDIQGKKIGIPRTTGSQRCPSRRSERNGRQCFHCRSLQIMSFLRIGIWLKSDKDIINREVDAVTFTSTLTVQNLFKMVKGEKKEEILKY